MPKPIKNIINDGSTISKRIPQIPRGIIESRFSIRFSISIVESSLKMILMSNLHL